MKYVVGIIFVIGLSTSMWAMQDQVKNLEQKVCVLKKLLNDKNKKIVRGKRLIGGKNKKIRVQKCVIKAQKENIENYIKSLRASVDMNLELQETLRNIITSL